MGKGELEKRIRDKNIAKDGHDTIPVDGELYLDDVLNIIDEARQDFLSLIPERVSARATAEVYSKIKKWFGDGEE